MPETVLVVDDEEIVREVLAEILRDAGYAILEASQGAEALASLETRRVDVVVSDISMPVMDGYALYDRIRTHPDWANLPFVFLTAHGESPRMRHAKELGVDDYLVKPVSSEDLVITVRALLQRHARLVAARDAQIGRLKEAILTAVAHELRTPLTLVSGYAELLAESSREEADRMRQLVEGVLKGTRRLQRLASDLVFLVELRSGEAHRRFEASKHPLSLADLLRDVADARRSDAESGGATLSVEIPETLPRVVGDPRLLNEALDRLLDNAIKFSKQDGGPIALRARAAADGVVIEVEDHGIGIAAAELERICDLFHQVDRAQNEQQGVGCGLTVARTIALMHGGELGVRSAPGTGSNFSLSLPARAL